MAGGKRITKTDVRDEIQRLKSTWSYQGEESDSIRIYDAPLKLPAELSGSLDLFDQAQLKEVLQVCSESSTMAEAGRRLFAISRTKLKAPNDSDRIRKYLSKFGLQWNKLQKQQPSTKDSVNR